MRYHCPHCDYFYEGQSQGVHEILEHDKTHPENSVDLFNNTEEYKKFCSHCGCTVEHDRTMVEDARTLSINYTEEIPLG